MNLPAPEARDRRFCTALFAVVLGLHGWCSHLGWTNAPVDGHEFRQTQTAISIRYLAEEGLRLDYPTPLLGKPWSIPLEFPLYQNAAALLVRLTGMPVEQAARTVGLLFFYLALPALYLLAGRFTLPPARRWLILSAILASPLYLFYQRTVMIETTVLCLGAWFLWAFWRALAEGGRSAIVLALVCGGLAGMVKMTTLVVFLPAAGFILLGEVWRPAAAGHASRRSRLGILATAGLLAGGALGAGLVWTVHADAMKALNPLAGFLQSSAVSVWAIGGAGLRFSIGFWTGIFSTFTDAVVGVAGWLLLGVAMWRGSPLLRRRLLLLLACALSGPLIFATLYQVHDYYFFSPGIFLLGAYGLALGQVLDQPALPQPLRWIIITLALSAGYINYTRTYYGLIPANETRVPELSRALKAVTQSDDVLVIFGQDWNPVLPYMAERRALMIPFPMENNLEAQAAAFTLLNQDTVGALVAPGPQRYRADLLQPVIRQFGLSSSPVLTGDVTDVYLPSAKQRVAVPVLAGLNLHQHHIDTRGQRIAVAEMPAGSANLFTMMTPPPREVAAQFGIGLNPLGDREVFGAHPSSELVFPAPPGARRLRAGFGLLPGAYADSAKHTDGVLFEVLRQTSEGQFQLLAERLLLPATRETDRGTQVFDLDLPAGASGDIILRTGPGPANDLAFDWAYWSFVTIK